LLGEKYKIIRELGEGGMGRTYLAENVKLKRECVLKTMLRSELNERDLQIIEHEAQMMAKCNHPHLPDIYDFDFVGERPYIIMEYIEGETLSEKNEISMDDALDWLRQMLDAIRYIHQQKIIHRDIHPHNICIQSKTNRAFLLDFGIARRLDSTRTNRTELFLIARNRDYAPIEQQYPDQLEAQSLKKVADYVRQLQKNGYRTQYYTDIYALAATFYAKLTNRLPTNPGGRVWGEELDHPHVVNPDIPEYLSEVLWKALALHPRDRYQSAQAMLDALKKTKKSPRGSQVIITRPDERSVVGGMEFVRIPAGEFLMGSDEAELKKAKCSPRHPVKLDTYFIGRYPATNREYQRFIDAHPKYPIPASTLPEAQPYCWNPITRRYPDGLADCPVVLVSWKDALDYCRWLSQTNKYAFCLPSEAEWEKAAGWDATTNTCRRYPWGSEFENGRCNIGSKQLTSVNQYSPKGDSPYGLADMVGNIWQWTSSYYWRYPYDPQSRRDKQDYDGRRVSRGGAYNAPFTKAHCAWRERFAASLRQPNLGFRLICTMQSV